LITDWTTFGSVSRAFATRPFPTTAIIGVNVVGSNISAATDPPAGFAAIGPIRPIVYKDVQLAVHGIASFVRQFISQTMRIRVVMVGATQMAGVVVPAGIISLAARGCFPRVAVNLEKFSLILAQILFRIRLPFSISFGYNFSS
jgi:hypothetical protein